MSSVSDANPDAQYNHNLAPPNAPYIAPSISSTPRGSAYVAETPRESVAPDNSSPLLTAAEKVSRGEEDDRSKSRPLWKRPAFWLVFVVGIIIVVVAVVVPVYFKVIKPNKNNVSGGSSSGDGNTGSGGSSGGGSGSGNTPTPSGAISGGDGSVITTEDGTKFTYTNSFGGFCEFS